MASRRPKAEADGFFVRTFNSQGFMSAYPSDPFMKEFIRNSPSAPGPVLDIGAAYGVASLECLKLGAKVVANDSDAEHLEILKEDTPQELKSNLTLLPGSFPSELEVEPGSIGAALVARVLHFFTGPEIEESAQKLFEWLAPGGRVYVTAETPYLKNLGLFTAVYEDRVKQGRKWPGFLDTLQDVDARKAYNLPKSMHFLDPVILRRVFGQAGFEIEKCEIFARPEFPKSLRMDGRESVGMIAIKP